MSLNNNFHLCKKGKFCCDYSVSCMWRIQRTHTTVSPSLFFTVHGPRGLVFTWWGWCGLCFSHKPTELAKSSLFCSCVSFSLYGPFNCVSFHQFSRQLSAFSLCSCGLITASLVFSALYLFLKVSLNVSLRDRLLCVASV